MKEMQYLQQLLLEKETQTLTDEEKEKVQLIKDIFKVPNCFFQLNIETSIGILSFLEIPDEKIKDVYFSLIAPDKLQKKVEKVTISKEK